MTEYSRPGILEVTYSDGIKQRFVIDRGGSSRNYLDSVIVHHEHTAKYL